VNSQSYCKTNYTSTGAVTLKRRPLAKANTIAGAAAAAAAAEHFDDL